jgi:hypothetical protein
MKRQITIRQLAISWRTVTSVFIFELIVHSLIITTVFVLWNLVIDIQCECNATS